MNRFLITGLIGAAAAGAGPAAAGSWEVSRDFGAMAAYGVLDAEGSLAAEPFAARVFAFVEAERLFDNGLALAAGLGGAAEFDHPFGGAVGPGAPARGLIAGGVRGDVVSDDRDRAALEAAYLALRGPWGEAAIGRDQGVAERYSLSPPDAARGLRLTDARLSLSGQAGVSVVNDISGPAAKAVLETPRLLGVRLGLSYAPDLEGENLQDGGADAPGAPAADLDEIWELGLSFQRGEGVALGLAAATAQTPEGADLARIAGGAQLGAGAWRVGISGQWSDQGQDQDYRAGAIGARWEGGAWGASAGYAIAHDDLLRVDATVISLAASRKVRQTTELAFGIRSEVQESAGAPTARAAGPFLEFSVRL